MVRVIEYMGNGGMDGKWVYTGVGMRKWAKREYRWRTVK